MKIIPLIVYGFILNNGNVTYAQKAISEGTITYDILVESKNSGAKVGSGLNGATSTLFLKGGLSRTDMVSTLGTETTIYNAKNGNAAILKEYSGQKLMITLTKENWEARNKKYDGIAFQDAPETKVIEGYKCKRSTANLKDGTTLSVYYSPDLIAMNKAYNEAFSNLPGFPMEYQFESEKLIFKYQLSKIDLGPVPASKFELPKSGFRIMTYEENKSGKVE